MHTRCETRDVLRLLIVVFPDLPVAFQTLPFVEEAQHDHYGSHGYGYNRHK